MVKHSPIAADSTCGPSEPRPRGLERRYSAVSRRARQIPKCRYRIPGSARVRRALVQFLTREGFSRRAAVVAGMAQVTLNAIAVFLVVAVLGAAAGLSVAAQSPVSQWAGVYSETQADRGGKLYADRCAGCHADDASGGTAPALVGSDFSARWDRRPLSDLFDEIQTTMPLNAPGSLSDVQTVDIMAFLLKKGGHPAGLTDLPREASRLGGIMFLATPPTKANQ